ncbi:MAG: hypothetical protein P8176_11115 [Gammaproteobacteria bacterium]
MKSNPGKYIYRTFAILTVFSILLWPLSYFHYFVASTQAYSGNATEVLAVKGNLIYFYFNNYEGNKPKQTTTMRFVSRNSQMGSRLSVEFDFAKLESVSNQLGFVLIKDSKNIVYGNLLIVSVPVWLFSVVFTLLTIIFKRMKNA